MSLSFLAKKSWNTKNLKNVKKVWEAEKEKVAEEKKIMELKKQLEEERERLKLKRMHEANTGVNQKDRKRLDWMYHGSTVENEKVEGDSKRLEEFLLGKKVGIGGSPSSTLKTSIDPTPSAAWSLRRGNDSSCDRAIAGEVVEKFRPTHEDPMYFILQQKIATRAKSSEHFFRNPSIVTGNSIVPVDHKKEYEVNVGGGTEKGMKKRKKEKKKKKKDKKKRKHVGDECMSPCGQDNGDRDLKRSKRRIIISGCLNDVPCSEDNMKPVAAHLSKDTAVMSSAEEASLGPTAYILEKRKEYMRESEKQRRHSCARW